MSLKDHRIAAGLTQRQLAGASGVDQQVVSYLERGKVKAPSWPVVRKLSAALEVAPEVLFPVEVAEPGADLPVASATAIAGAGDDEAEKPGGRAVGSAA